MVSIRAEVILVETAKAGAFKSDGFDQSIFVRCVEYKLNIASRRAIDLLVASGLVTFALDPDPSIHIRERCEYWLLTPTEAGVQVLTTSNQSPESDA